MIYELQISTVAEDSILLGEFSHRFSWLRERGYLLGVKQVTYKNSNILMINLTLQGENSDIFMKDEDIIYIFKHQISEFLAEHILHDWEEKMVRREITKRTRHIALQDHEVILHKAIDFLRRCNANESINLLLNYGRKNKISHKIMDYIYANNKLVIEGLINFCLQDYLSELRFAVDMACEELNSEKEYNDFIKLLRYFVDSQMPRVCEVNLLMEKNGLFSLWDDKGVSIDEKFLNYYSNEVLYNDVSLDDILVSILITISPRRIILHNAEKETSEPVKVIRQVFANRIRDCSGCERCMKSREGDLKQHH